ncbi:hypothetical protein KIPB_016772, partial [Kipferlia bialata]
VMEISSQKERVEEERDSLASVTRTTRQELDGVRLELRKKDIENSQLLSETTDTKRQLASSNRVLDSLTVADQATRSQLRELDGRLRRTEQERDEAKYQ